VSSSNACGAKESLQPPKPEDALKSLKVALQKGYPAQEAWNDPELQKLQALPQFAQLEKEFTPKTTKL
jgi:hypothetical protein